MSPDGLTVGDEPLAVRVARSTGGWEVRVLAASGEARLIRPCADEDQARTFASTVRQHLHWLSPAKFRSYYGLEEPG